MCDVVDSVLDSWSPSYCLQGGARPIWRSVSVLVLGYNYCWECHILNGVLWFSGRSSVDVGLQLSIVHNFQDFPF